MPNANVISEFLVAIGYKIDTTGASRAVEAQKTVEREVIASDKRRTEGSLREQAIRQAKDARARGERLKGFAAIHEDLKKHAEAERKVHEQSARSIAERGLAEAKTLKERFQWRRRLDAMDQQAQRAREKVDKAAHRATEKEHTDRQSLQTAREKEFYARRQAMVSNFSQGVLSTLTALGVATTASGVIRGFENMAGGLERLYHAAARTGATAGGLRSFGYAASQAGSTADSAVGSLEALASKMRRSPGYETMLQGLGVPKKDAKGNDLPMEQRALRLGQVFAKQPEHQALAYGDSLGINEQDVLALRSGEMQKRFDEGERMRAKAGLNTQKAAESGKAFAEMYRRLGETISIIGEKIEGALAGSFGKKVEQFAEYLLANAEPIAKAAVRIGETMLRLATSAVDLVKSFNELSPGTKGLILQLGALAAALLVFTSGPLTALAGLAAGIVLLYDDYTKWKNGSRDGFIDWDTWEPAIKNTLNACQKLAEWFGSVAKALTGQEGLTVAFELLAVALAGKLLAPLTKVVGLMGSLGSMRPPPWLLGLLGVTGAAAVANANGILDAGEGSRSWHERLIRTLEPRAANAIYGQTEKTKAADAKDGRTLWQRIAPQSLGGKPAPESSERGSGNITGPISNPPTEPGKAEVRAYVRAEAAELGIDPNVAERVIEQESRFDRNATNINKNEESYGPMQLNMKGGLGAVALKQGINPRDASTWKQQVDFGLGVVKKDGWRQWYGARDVGISRWQGIGGSSAETTASIAPTGGVGGVDQQQGRVAEVRRQAITDELRDQLAYAGAQAGVNAEVFSGGQDAHGSNRTGSHRHDNGGSADLKLYRVGADGKRQYLDMTNPADQRAMESFLKHSVHAGATGVGAAPGYMGVHGIHVGGGPSATWGAGERSATTEDWVRRAHQEGTAMRERAQVSLDAWKKSQAAAADASAVARTEALGNGQTRIVPKGKGPAIIGGASQWRADAEARGKAIHDSLRAFPGSIGADGPLSLRGSPLGVGGNTDNSRSTSIKTGDTNLTIHTHGDAKDTAEATGRVMRNQNADLLRNMKSSFA